MYIVFLDTIKYFYTSCAAVVLVSAKSVFVPDDFLGDLLASGSLNKNILAHESRYIVAKMNTLPR